MKSIELLERLMSCVTAEAGGRTESIRRRRGAILSYWIHCKQLATRDERAPVPAEWYGRLADLFQAYTADSEGTANGDVEARDAWDVLNAIGEVVRAIDFATAGFDATPDACLRRALAELFDWESNLRLRAYVYAVTGGEILSDAVAKKEKCEFLARLDQCLESLADDVDTLFGDSHARRDE